MNILDRRTLDAEMAVWRPAEQENETRVAHGHGIAIGAVIALVFWAAVIWVVMS